MPTPQDAASDARARILASASRTVSELANSFFRSVISHPVNQQADGSLTRDVYTQADVANEPDPQKKVALTRMIGKPKAITQEEADEVHAQRSTEAQDALRDFFRACEDAAIEALAHHLHPEHLAEIVSDVRPDAAPAGIYHPGA